MRSADAGFDQLWSAGKEPIPFGALLRELRLAARLTQAVLSERSGISTRAIQHLELGLGQPRRDTARRLADALALTGEQRARFEAAATPSPRQRPAPARSALSADGGGSNRRVAAEDPEGGPPAAQPIVFARDTRKQGRARFSRRMLISAVSILLIQLLVGLSLTVSRSSHLWSGHSDGPNSPIEPMFITAAVAEASVPVVWSDDFADPAAGWLPSTRRTRTHQTGYAEGRYYIHKTDPDHSRLSAISLPGTYDDVSFAVDASIERGVGNMILVLSCRRQDDLDTGYRFWVDVARGRFRIRRGSGIDSGAELVSWELTGALRGGGATNRLELSCQGTTISATINGVRVADVQDDVLAYGRAAIGLQATRSTALVWFDNLAVAGRYSNERVGPIVWPAGD